MAAHWPEARSQRRWVREYLRIVVAAARATHLRWVRNGREKTCKEAHAETRQGHHRQGCQGIHRRGTSRDEGVRPRDEGGRAPRPRRGRGTRRACEDRDDAGT